MKHMNMMERYWPISLQIFADGDEGESGDEGEDEDDSDDEGDDGEDDDDEKRFSQKDIDEAIKKRLAREKRKWLKEQRKAGKKKPDSKGNAGENDEEDEETKELRDKAAKADEMELKWICLEHDVDKSCVDDVLALARVHVAKDDSLDIEDAIDDVLKKYPQFKASSGSEDDEEAEEKGKSWGQRQSGRKKKSSGVEAAFYARNPELKPR